MKCKAKKHTAGHWWCYSGKPAHKVTSKKLRKLYEEILATQQTVSHEFDVLYLGLGKKRKKK